jgi:ribosomal protein L39E
MTANCIEIFSSYLNTKHVSQLTKENRIQHVTLLLAVKTNRAKPTHLKLTTPHHVTYDTHFTNVLCFQNVIHGYMRKHNVVHAPHRPPTCFFWGRFSRSSQWQNGMTCKTLTPDLPWSGNKHGKYVNTLTSTTEATHRFHRTCYHWRRNKHTLFVGIIFSPLTKNVHNSGKI